MSSMSLHANFYSGKKNSTFLFLIKDFLSKYLSSDFPRKKIETSLQFYTFFHSTYEYF